VPELAAKAETSLKVGLVGTFRSSIRADYARHVENCLRQTLEELSGRWTVEVLLPAVMKRCEEVERRLGEHANAQVTELDGVLSSVWTRAGTRDVRHEMGPRINKISSALPGMSNRLFSYWGVANGFRSLLAVLSCNLMAGYAYVFVGALGAAVSSWLAIRSAGKETEKQIRTIMGEELGKALRERAHSTADGIAGMSMQPCEDAIDRYEAVFGKELKELKAAIDLAADTICQGPEAIAGQRVRSDSLAKELEAARGVLSSGQYDLIQGNSFSPRS